MYSVDMKKNCYFFTTRKRECSVENRPKKRAGNGYWISLGIQNLIYRYNQPIGIKSSFNFYEGVIGKELKTDWIMQEYTLHPNNTPSIDTKLEEWVLCIIYNESNLDQNDEDISDVTDQDSPVFNKTCRSEAYALRSPLQGRNGNICSPIFEPQFIWSSPPKLHEIDIIQMHCCAKHNKDFLILNESCLGGKPGSENCLASYPRQDFPMEQSKSDPHLFPCCSQSFRDCSTSRLLEKDDNQSCRHCHNSPLPCHSRHDCINPLKLPMKELIFPENSYQLENPICDDAKSEELNDHIEVEQILSVDDINFVNGILKFLDDQTPLEISSSPEYQQMFGISRAKRKASIT